MNANTQKAMLWSNMWFEDACKVRACVRACVHVCVCGVCSPCQDAILTVALHMQAAYTWLQGDSWQEVVRIYSK